MLVLVECNFAVSRYVRYELVTLPNGVTNDVLRCIEEGFEKQFPGRGVSASAVKKDNSEVRRALSAANIDVIPRIVIDIHV